MARSRRLEIIREIERKRKSRLIAYVTGDRLGVPAAHIGSEILPIMAQHMSELVGESTEKFDLFLYSRGGHSDAPSSIVTFVREVLGARRFEVLIPSLAHSAATVIAIGADRIVMSALAELGPIDATIQMGPHNPRDPKSSDPLPISVEDVRGYMDLLNFFDLRRDDQKMQAFSGLIKEVPALGLGAVSRMLSQTRKVAEQLLGGRHDRLKDEDIERIVATLSSEIGSHSHTIRRTEARNIGISFIDNSESVGIDGELLALFGEYRDLLHLDLPFDGQGELISEDSEQKTYDDMKLAIIESTYRKDVFQTSLRVSRLRQAPPQISLDVHLAPIALPPAPPNVDAQNVLDHLERILSPIIQRSVDESVARATEQIVKTMPQRGFQTIQYNSLWREDSGPE